MHRGVATRTFARGFNLSDDVEVGTVKAHKRDACGRIAEDHPRSSESSKIYEIGNPLANTSTDSN